MSMINGTTATTDAAGAIEWTTPPPAPTHGRSVGSANAASIATRDALVANSGQWARTATGIEKAANAHARARRIRSGASVWAGHEWETAVRQNNAGTHDLFVRHVGELDDTNNDDTEA